MQSNDPLVWLWSEGEDVTFDNADTLLMTCLPAHCLQNWTNRGLFTPSVAGGGKGLRRRYSVHDVIVLSLAAKLVALNITTDAGLSLAMDIWIATLKAAKKNGGDPHALGTSIAFVKASKGGAMKVSIVTQCDTYNFGDMADGQPVVMFAVGAVIRKAAEKAMSMGYVVERPARYAEARS